MGLLGSHRGETSMIFWPGLIAIGALYVAVFGVGVYATRSAGDSDEDSLTELMLAGRNLPMWVGLLTMTATWVGGGYINGTAEQTYANGILWGAQAGIEPDPCERAPTDKFLPTRACPNLLHRLVVRIDNPALCRIGHRGLRNTFCVQHILRVA